MKPNASANDVEYTYNVAATANKCQLKRSTVLILTLRSLQRNKRALNVTCIWKFADNGKCNIPHHTFPSAATMRALQKGFKLLLKGTVVRGTKPDNEESWNHVDYNTKSWNHVDADTGSLSSKL
jgi:hypothetical protein